MTVIAWDGKTLAADKRATNNGRATTVTKLFRHGEYRLAVSGELVKGLEMIEWLRGGAAPEKLPAFQKTSDFVAVLRIGPDGAYLYENSHIPFKIEEPFYAMGSGRDFALMALHLGSPAARAVELTNELDTTCGNGVDVMEA